MRVTTKHQGNAWQRYHTSMQTTHVSAGWDGVVSAGCCYCNWCRHAVIVALLFVPVVAVLLDVGLWTRWCVSPGCDFQRRGSGTAACCTHWRHRAQCWLWQIALSHCPVLYFQHLLPLWTFSTFPDKSVALAKCRPTLFATTWCACRHCHRHAAINTLQAAVCAMCVCVFLTIITHARTDARWQPSPAQQPPPLLLVVVLRSVAWLN